METISFGSMFIAMESCSHYANDLCYKIRMMGKFLLKLLHSYVLGDNKAVLTNSLMLRSTFKKTSSSVACHFVCEGA